MSFTAENNIFYTKSSAAENINAALLFIVQLIHNYFT